MPGSAGKVPKNQAGGERDQESKRQYPAVDRDGRSTRRVTAGELGQHVEPDVGEHQPEAAADHRQHGALGQQLPDQPTAAGAEGGTHGDLLLAAHDSRQAEVGDVGAGDQQYQPGGGQQRNLLRPAPDQDQNPDDFVNDAPLPIA